MDILLGRCSSHNLVFVSGGANGADRMAEIFAREHDIPIEVYRAEWNTFGKSAGAIRNQRMLASGCDLVVAFPGGRGTADMVSRARRAGVEVIAIETD